MKKGQGLSLNTIIIAAIVLVVLIVLWAIFTGRMGVFSTGLKQVESCKDACVAIGEVESTSSNDAGRRSIGMVGSTECFCKLETPTAPATPPPTPR